MLIGPSAALLLAEAGLRSGDISFPSFYIVDEYRGNALRPGAEGWWRSEGEAYIKINSDGLRDREHSKNKPANTLRIAVLGDSYAEALQVSTENAFWSVLEKRLQPCPTLAGRNIEVINFGVSGHGTAQELLTLRYHAWAYSPDIILLAFTAANDVRNNSVALEPDRMRPFFIYRDRELVLDLSFRDSKGYRFRRSTFGKTIYLMSDSSRILQAINYVKNTRSIDTRVNRQKGMGPARASKELGLDNMVFCEPKDQSWREAWDITERLMILMNTEIAEKGAKFLLVTLSSGIQAHPDSAVRQAFMKQLNITDLFYPDLRVKALCERENIVGLNLAHTFQAYAQQHNIFLHGFGSYQGTGHWNTKGHQLAGEIIAQKICEIIPSP